MSDPRALYLDLLKRSLTNWIYGPQEPVPLLPGGRRTAALTRLLAKAGVRLVSRRPFDPAARAEGRDWPPTAHTMIGLRRLDALQALAEDVLARGVPGDFLEAGVWRGGASILLRGVLRAHGDTSRTVWVADSFEGLPPPDPERFPADRGDRHHLVPQLAVPLEEVKANFERYGLLDGKVRFLQGWFRDTLPGAPVERLALLRLDGDMYESTWTALEALYPKLSPGGWVMVDDYDAVPACNRAVDDYRARHGITAPLERTPVCGASWRKP